VGLNYPDSLEISQQLSYLSAAEASLFELSLLPHKFGFDM
jgi:hypothetical protein